MMALPLIEWVVVIDGEFRYAEGTSAVVVPRI